jgi:hypothetical protein
MKELKDNLLTSVLYDSCIITGGCISSLYFGEKVNDIDLYAKDTKKLATVKTLITDISIHIKEVKGYSLTDADNRLITNNAITLKNDVQFITIADAETCRKKFDFIHCMPWFDIKTQKLHISESQFNSIKNRQLVPNISGETIKEYRLQKYLDKGWKSWEPKQTTSIVSAIDTLTTSVLAWKENGTESLGLDQSAMTDLFQKIVDQKSQFTLTCQSSTKV